MQIICSFGQVAVCLSCDAKKGDFRYDQAADGFVAVGMLKMR
jgi:hypothetical protein